MKRLLCTVLIPAVALFAGAFAEDRPQRQVQDRPNFIIILCDDLGYADVGFNNSEDIRTPQLDRLAHGGMIFTSGYVAHPFCGPSRMSLMAGRYSHEFGGPFNLPISSDGPEEYYKHGIPESEKLISNELQDAGYFTGAIGKWHMGMTGPYHPNNRGFDEYYGFLGGGHRYFPSQFMPAYKRRLAAGDEVINEYLIPLEHNGEQVDEKEYITDALSREAVNFVHLADRQDKPFFLYLAYNAPHSPLEAKEEDLALYSHISDQKRRIYAAMVHAVDRGVGRLVEALEETGAYENTLIVFFSDNGGKESLGADNGPLLEGKGSTAEGGIRVPMFFHYPARLEAGQVYRHPVTALDLYPTFAALARAEISEDKILSGKNIWPALQSGRAARPGEMIYALRHRKGFHDVGGRIDRWKIHRLYQGPWKLFNIEEDIGETQDLSNQYPEQVESMVARLEQWSRTHTEPKWFHIRQEGREWHEADMPRFDETFLLKSGVVGSSGSSAGLEAQALVKMDLLKTLMDTAHSQSIDVTREETVMWFAGEFLKFADWDEKNAEANEYLFGVYREPFKSQKEKLAAELPDFERKKVIEILDKGIATLEAVLSGEIVRRPVNKVDWQNIEVAEDVLLSNGKPIFLYDYFSKSVGRPLTDTQVYNDHLGAIFHGGENLYPVDHDRAINSFLLKEDGSWDEDLLREITGISDTNVGFLLFWNGGIPDWVLAKEPEANKGRSLFTGFDIDNPLVRDVWGKIARKAGELTQGKKVTQLGYILSNEPHWFAAQEHWTQRFLEMNSVSSYTDANFKAWLRETYGGRIEKLNENWETSFADFESVTYPFPISRSYRGKPMWYDWCRYNMRRGTDWFTYIQGELRKGNPDAHTSIKLQPNLFSENYRSHGIDVEALTELTSMIGDDAKTQWIRNLNRAEPDPWEAHYAYFWEELSMTYDFLQSVAPNKIHFNSENHFLSASWVRELDMPEEYVRNVYWLATIQGMDANLAWWWARDPDGSPEDRMEGELNFFDPALAGSYAASANQQPHVVNEVTQVMYDLNSFSEEVMAIRKQRRPVRLFYSETSAINKRRHMTDLFEIYEQLFFEGFPLGFATEKIIQKQDANSWDVIVVYKTDYVTDAEFDTLQSYLDNGGTVLMDNLSSLAKNEYGRKRSEHLRSGNGQLVVMGKQASPKETKAKALELIETSLPELVLTEDNGTDYKGCTWRVARGPDSNLLLNILNLGKHSAKLDIQMKNGEAAAATDMLTGRAMGSDFKLNPNGVLLLEVK